MEACVVCGGDSVKLGTLGSLTHYRCGSCGITFSGPIQLEWDDDDD